MNSEALLQMVDLLHAQKNIPHEVIFRALEESMAAAVRKRFGEGEDLVCTIDRETGEVTVEDDEGVYEFEMSELGRIVAQTVKQGFTQRVREAERDVFYDKYETRVGQLISGEVQRYEGQDLVVSLGDVETLTLPVAWPSMLGAIKKAKMCRLPLKGIVGLKLKDS